MEDGTYSNTEEKEQSLLRKTKGFRSLRRQE